MDRSLYSDIKEKASNYTERDPYLAGLDRLVLSDKKRHNIDKVIERNRRKLMKAQEKADGRSTTQIRFQKIIDRSGIDCPPSHYRLKTMN